MRSSILCISIFLLACFSMAHAAEPIDPCELQSIAVLSEQTKSLPCTARQITELVLNGSRTVPDRIYHYGRFKYMMENVKNRTISQQAWDKYIMGKITRYGLGSTRRGLYGTAGIDTNSFSSGKYNWLMEIHIDPKCTTPEKVVSIENLQRNKRFLDWYKKSKIARKKVKFDQFQRRCASFDFQGFTYKDCREVVLRFLKEQDIKVILDHAIDKSFYIRDRSCIKTIKGSPTEIIEMFANIDFLWQNICKDTYGYRDGTTFRIAYLILRGLTDSKKEFPRTYYEKLDKQIKAVRFSSKRINQDIFVKAVQLHQKCAKNLKHHEFENALSPLVAEHLIDEQYPPEISYFDDRGRYNKKIQKLFDTTLDAISSVCEF